MMIQRKKIETSMMARKINNIFKNLWFFQLESGSILLIIIITSSVITWPAKIFYTLCSKCPLSSLTEATEWPAVVHAAAMAQALLWAWAQWRCAALFLWIQELLLMHTIGFIGRYNLCIVFNCRKILPKPIHGKLRGSNVAGTA